MGGFCSILINTLVTMFIIVQLYAFFFSPSYSQAQSITYLDSSVGKKAKAYDIAPGEFVPTFFVQTHTGEGDFDGNVYNDRTKFDIYFETIGTGEEGKTRYEAILCHEYIFGEHWSDYS